MRTSSRVAAAALAVATGLICAPVAAADPAPPPTPIDCGPYGGMSKALEAAAEHLSPPLGEDRPIPDGFRAPPPLRCQ
jgi:hypothetical protein